MAEVLLIEDDPAQRHALSNTLRRIGFSTVESVVDGSFAVESLDSRIAAQEKLPEAIVLDLDMRLTSGYEVLRYCKSHPECREVNVVIVSRQKSDNEIQVCLYMGAKAFISKDQDRGAIEQQLRNAFSNLSLRVNPELGRST